MPKLHINVAKPSPGSGLPRWVVGVFAAAVAAILVFGGIQAAKRFRTLRWPMSVSAPVRPQPPRTEASAPSTAPSAGPPGKAPSAPAATPVASGVPQPGLPATATLRAVHPASQPDSTEIKLDLDRPVEIHAAALHDPERVFFDLSNTAIAAHLGSASDVTTVEFSDPRVQRIRIGPRGDATRVVFDLSCPCGYSYKMAQHPPYELVVTVQAR